VENRYIANEVMLRLYSVFSLETAACHPQIFSLVGLITRTAASTGIQSTCTLWQGRSALPHVQVDRSEMIQEAVFEWFHAPVTSKTASRKTEWVDIGATTVPFVTDILKKL
jgi:hypothetical protein